MITVKLYQKKTKLRADGTAPIYYVLSEGRKQKLIATRRYVEPEYFDNEKGLVLKGSRNSIKLNSYLRAQLTRIDEIILEETNKRNSVTFERIEQIYTNTYSNDFIQFANSELKGQQGLISDKTYTVYNERLSALKKFRCELPFSAITHEFLTTYKHELIVRQGRKVNGVYQDFAFIKKFYRLAVIKGEAKGDPFAHFPLEREDTERNWLEEHELQRLHDILDGNVTSEKTKELTEAVKNSLRHFLFSCYTGIRFGDSKKKNEEHVINDRLAMKTTKTGKVINIPFNRQAKLLLEAVLTRKLKQSNKRVNHDLEKCMVAAGIKKEITYHCSRHTFAIHCILLGIDIITVRDWLGHASVTTTEIYAKIAQEYKDQSMKKWDNFGNRAA